MLRIVVSILLFLVLAGMTGALLISAGAYNVSAAIPHTEIVQWLFATVRDRSIAVRSDDHQAPRLDDRERIKAGLRSYHDMCRVCHGAPGEEPTPIRQGLNPQPPKLDAQRTQRRDEGELFWIIKNGIRMTGMPAFGKTHKDEDLWSLVAFIRHLPAVRPEQYEALLKEAGLPETPPPADGHDHEH
ncbi:c-type cytochrome [Candidatus Nitrospira bockiana]